MLLRARFAFSASLLFAGCVSLPPPPPYRKVDQNTPEFKVAAEQKAEALRAAGKSTAEAKEIAVRDVTKAVIQTQKKEQIDRVGPLVEALTAFERSAGCWAYTLTTTNREKGRTSVTVETFDPFQPEERIWTLVSRDGQTPEAEAQAEYRQKKLREWRKTRPPSRRLSGERVQRAALYSEAEVAEDEAAARTRFSFTRTNQTTPLLDENATMSERFVVDRQTRTVAQHQLVVPRPTSMFGGSLKVEHLFRSTDYVLLEPLLPPFLAKVVVRQHLHALGVDRGEVDLEMVYTNYRRVKCFDDRFEVKVGIPSVQDYLPGDSR